MASATMIFLAASGLVSAAVPATVPTAKSAGMVTSVSKARTGTCMVPTVKGKVTKLSTIRKARAGDSCSFQFMQAGAAGGAGAGGAGSLTGIAIGGAVGGAVGAGTAAAVTNSNNSTPNP